jgi:hypothetical protein
MASEEATEGVYRVQAIVGGKSNNRVVLESSIRLRLPKSKAY